MATLAFGVIGAAIGSTIPGFGTSWGWTVGTILGGLLFPPRLPGQGVGPLDDLRPGGSSYGTPIPHVYGRAVVAGSVIWQTDLVPQRAGGGGKGKIVPTGGEQYTYSGSFACYLCAGPVEEVEKIWFGDQLVYEAGETEFDIVVYLGTLDQLPDPTQEAAEGAGRVPGYRGKCYIQVNNLPLQDYGNGYPPVSAMIRRSSAREPIFSQTYGLESFAFVSIDGEGFEIDDAVPNYGTGSNPKLISDGREFVALAAGVWNGDGALAIEAETGQLIATGNIGGVTPDSNYFFGAGIPMDGAGSLDPSTWVDSVTYDGNDYDLPTFDLPISALSIGYGLNAVVHGAGRLAMWGRDGDAFGEGTGPVFAPVEIESSGVTWAHTGGGDSGQGNTCYVKDGRLFVCGSNSQGQLGLGDTTGRTTFVEVTDPNIEGLVVKALFSNEAFPPLVVQSTCLVVELVDGTVWVTGSNSGNFNGDTTFGTGASTIFRQVPGVTNVDDIAIGGRAVFAHTTDNEVISWGRNTDGEAGQGAVGGLHNPAVIFSGARGIGARKGGGILWDMDGEAYGWGAIGANVPTSLGFSLEFSVVDLQDVLDDVAQKLKIPSGLYDFSGGAGEEITGYLIGQRGEARGQIAPLLEVKSYDLTCFDGKLQVRRRGGAVDWVIDEGDLGARFADDQESIPRPIQFRRTQDIELPALLEIAYFDAAHERFDTATQPFQRSDKALVTDKVTYNAPIVMTATEARQTIHTLGWTAWTDANGYSISLPWKYLGIAPADILSVPHDGGFLRSRVEKITYIPLAFIQLELRKDDPANLVHYIEGQEVTVVEEERRGDVGPLFMIAWNGNAFRDEDAGRQDIYWAWNVTSGPSDWMFYFEVSTDDGATWETLFFHSHGNQVSRQSIGQTTTILAAPDPETSGLVDDVNTVNVVVYGDPPESCSIEDMIGRGMNQAILGDEIIAFATVTPLGSNIYQLSNLLRGLRGTDWAWDSHAVGDRFGIARFAPLESVPPFNRTNMNAWQMPIGATFDVRLRWLTSLGGPDNEYIVEDVEIIGRELMPYTVVDVEGERDGGNDLTITWTRRTRIGGQWAPFTDVPIGETEERYEIDIYLLSAVVRTIIVSTPSTVYTAAEQTADGITPGDPVDMIIYQVGATGRGFPREVTL